MGAEQTPPLGISGANWGPATDEGAAGGTS